MYFTLFSSVSIVGFKQLNVSWILSYSRFWNYCKVIWSKILIEFEDFHFKTWIKPQWVQSLGNSNRFHLLTHSTPVSKRESFSADITFGKFTVGIKVCASSFILKRNFYINFFYFRALFGVLHHTVFKQNANNHPMFLGHLMFHFAK